MALSAMLQLFFLVCLFGYIQGRPGLDPDNPGHRGFSDSLDQRYSGRGWYDKAVRPIVHGTYHAGRFVNGRNPEEWARAKDQFSKVGSGQQRTEYLKEHRTLQG